MHCAVLVVSQPHSLNIQSCFCHEWILFELVAFLYLYVVNNLPLAFVMCRCDSFCCYWWCCSLWCRCHWSWYPCPWTTGLTLDIPLWNHSSILMTLWLLYDCYIQLSTLELSLDKTLHYNAHVPMWDKMARASHARHCWHSDCCGETNSLASLWWSKVVSWCQAWSSVTVSVRSILTSC